MICVSGGISWRQETMFYSLANLGSIQSYVRVDDFLLKYHFCLHYRCLCYWLNCYFSKIGGQTRLNQTFAKCPVNEKELASLRGGCIVDRQTNPDTCVPGPKRYCKLQQGYYKQNISNYFQALNGYDSLISVTGKFK